MWGYKGVCIHKFEQSPLEGAVDFPTLSVAIIILSIIFQVMLDMQYNYVSVVRYPLSSDNLT